MKENIRIRSILFDVLKMCLQIRQKRKIFVLIFLFALPAVILVWGGLLVSFAFCLSLGLSGAYLFITSITESHFDYFAFLFFLIGSAGICAGVLHFRYLRTSFKSGKILIEQLLPVVGVILWLLGLIGVAIWLFIVFSMINGTK